MKHIQTFESVFDKIETNTSVKQLEEELAANPIKSVESLWDLFTVVILTS